MCYRTREGFSLIESATSMSQTNRRSARDVDSTLLSFKSFSEYGKDCWNVKLGISDSFSLNQVQNFFCCRIYATAAYQTWNLSKILHCRLQKLTKEDSTEGSIFVVIDQRERKEISLRANIHMPGCYRMENAQKITNSNVNGYPYVQFPFMQGGYRRGKCESTEGKAYWQTNWGRDFQGFVLIHTLWSDSTSLKQHWINQSGIYSFSKKLRKSKVWYNAHRGQTTCQRKVVPMIFFLLLSQLCILHKCDQKHSKINKLKFFLVLVLNIWNNLSPRALLTLCFVHIWVASAIR